MTKSTEGRNEEKISIFWRVFGGTILSIVALAVITLYNSISSNISDLRNEVNREREARRSRQEGRVQLTNHHAIRADALPMTA